MAANKLAFKETYLKDIIFGQEQITKDVEVREHIFEIKDSTNTLGFISLYDLKGHINGHEDELTNYYIRNIDSNDWILIFEHPFFQRRKPQLVSSEEIKNEDDSEFFVLIKGQKTGPYQKYEIMEKLENKELLLSDMVTLNGGATWIKIFQIDGFDRRRLKESGQLPGMPSEELLQRPIERKNKMDVDTDAMSSMAFLVNSILGKNIKRQREDFLQDETIRNDDQSAKYKLLLIASIIGIIYLIYFNSKSSLNSSSNAKNANAIGQAEEMLSPKDKENNGPAKNQTNNEVSNRQNNQINRQLNNQESINNNKFQRRSMAPVRPASRKSFMDTKNYRDNTPEKNTDNNAENSVENSAENNNYFYDNPAPMELDPVRSQISKENFDNPTEPGNTPPNDPLFNQEISN